VSRADEWIFPDEAGLRLILHVPGGIAPAALEDALRAAPVAAVVAPAPVLARLRPVCAGAPCALLTDDDVEPAATTADGVLLAEPEGTREARLCLGEERLLGVEVGHSRHAAMLAGEAGADFVVFRATDRAGRPDLQILCGIVRWWSGIAVLPCAAAAPAAPEAVAELWAAGADFLAVEPAIWQHREGAAAALSELAATMGRLPRRAPGGT
jgi:thiamine-phosphate pyrophosphorylase